MLPCEQAHIHGSLRLAASLSICPEQFSTYLRTRGRILRWAPCRLGHSAAPFQVASTQSAPQRSARPEGKPGQAASFGFLSATFGGCTTLQVPEGIRV